MNRTVHTVFARTLGRLWHSPTTLVGLVGFHALASGLLVFSLMRGDGGSTPVTAIWAVAAVPFLPILSALLTMRLIADERASGLLDLFLTAPILERDVVLGKFLGALAVATWAILLYLIVPFAVLSFCAPAVRGTLSVAAFLPAAGALLMQSVLWCAVGLFASACFRHAAAAAFASLVLMLALPRVAFEAATAWSPVLRARLSSIPFEAHIVDCATGLVRFSTLAFYGVLACFALFAATKVVAGARLRGRAVRGLRISTGIVVALALVFSVLVVALAMRLDFAFELPLREGEARTSARTRQILAETHGDVRVTCFLARRAPEFRTVSRLLRGLEATAKSVAGMHLSVDYVDPRWELGRAAGILRQGGEEGSLIFRRGRRRIAVPIRDLFQGTTNGVVATGMGGVFAGEAACASALQRLTLPAQRERIYWTVGHGEASFASYDAASGMSDIARELRRDGYQLAELDLTASAAVPADCAVLVVAGAREPFSRVESTRLAGWLQSGGRLLVLAAPGPNAGVGALLSDLGLRILPQMVVSPRTLTGADVVVRDLADHAVTRPLAGGTLVFSSPVAIALPAAEQEESVYTALARTDADAWGENDPAVRPWTRDVAAEPAGPFALAVAFERGGGVAKDVAIRPARVVVLGDAAFVANGALERHANGNRDLFLNAVAWLAGLDAVTASRTAGDVVQTGLDRAGWIRFGFVAALGCPLVMLFVGGVFLIVRRRAS